MAITAAALQAALGTNPMQAQVLQAFEPSQGTQQQWYVSGDAPGRCRMVNTTATQAAAVLVALRA